MQRSQVGALLKHLQHLIVEQHALVELLAAMHHAVTHGVDFLEVLDGPNLGVGEQREDELHTLGVLGNVVHDGFLLAIGEFHFHESAVQTHALGPTRGQHLFGIHVIERVLD